MAAPDQMIALPAVRSAELDAVAVARGDPSDHDSDTQVSSAVPGPGNGEFPGNPTTTSPSRRQRSTPSQEAPFAWQAKAALRAIIRSERVTHRGHALAVYDIPMHQAIQRLVDADISVVVSAGNDESYEVSQMVPAGFGEVIAVASTTATAGTSNNKRIKAIPADTASFFTTDGKYDALTGVGVAISAPGEEREDVVFPRIQSLGILSTALGGGTTRMSGTMAAPHVTGVVALLLQKEAALTPAEVKSRVMVGDREGVAPLNAAAGAYTFDGEREGILSAPVVSRP